MAAAYDARHSFVGLVPEREQWGDSCRVRVHERAWEDMFEFARLLGDARRRHYLDGAKAENGFFKGVTLTSGTKRWTGRAKRMRGSRSSPPMLVGQQERGGHTGDQRFFYHEVSRRGVRSRP